MYNEAERGTKGCDLMVIEERMYWELLNNEIRRVVRSDDGSKVSLITRFRTIQNELVFTGVIWSEKLELLSGEVINFVQEVSPETLTADIISRLKKSYSPDVCADDFRNGRKLFRIVCNRNQSEFFLIAGNIEIHING